MAAELEVVSVQWLIVKAENGYAHEYAAARSGPKGFVWAVYPFVLPLLFRSNPLLQMVDHFAGLPGARLVPLCFNLHDYLRY